MEERIPNYHRYDLILFLSNQRKPKREKEDKLGLTGLLTTRVQQNISPPPVKQKTATAQHETSTAQL
jgi:hypothetical protein